MHCPDYDGKECNSQGRCLSNTIAHGETTEPVQYDTRSEVYVHTKVGPGGLSRSPEALLGSESDSFAGSPTGYFCGSAASYPPAHSDWQDSVCSDGTSASLADQAAACDTDKVCMAFSVDTDNNNAMCKFGHATTKPRGDASKRCALENECGLLIPSIL